MSVNQNEVGFGIALRAVILNQEHILLLLRSKPSKGEHGYWELPGGRMHLGERYQEALKREVFEETGLKVEVLRPLTVFDAKRDLDTQVVGITFLCRMSGDYKEVTISDEHLDAKWVQIHHLESLKLMPGLKKEYTQWQLDQG